MFVTNSPALVGRKRHRDPFDSDTIRDPRSLKFISRLYFMSLGVTLRRYSTI